ncbi:coiled-coil domain-containing protein 18-like [Schistocerca cancellata]|uniref:coiled-coil domain-containing protein 18-like n=1 Tax=Schistocerca cancellata TaxID=274614 RepID=UPI00211985AF|nr:coiled-coil domain-containing protein 18-like [Schistocerca cancellata]
MEVKETESNHIHSQVSMEISLVQNQFQEQLQLLSSIPDAVNKLQLQVQEEEQQWCMAEFRRRELMHELYDAKQQMDCYTKEINEIQVRLQESKDEQKELHKQLKNCEKENEELQNEVSALKSNTEIMLSEYEMAEKNTKEKINEITQLSKKLETYSDDFAHELSHAKNQNEKTRIALQIKISQLDDDLLQLRTFAKVMEKDRDQVKMDLQTHINWLTEKNDEAAAIIHNLETQLNNSHSSDNTFHTTYISMAN